MVVIFRQDEYLYYASVTRGGAWGLIAQLKPLLKHTTTKTWCLTYTSHCLMAYQPSYAPLQEPLAWNLEGNLNTIRSCCLLMMLHRFWWLKIDALAGAGEWIELERFAKSKKSPIGYEVRLAISRSSIKYFIVNYIRFICNIVIQLLKVSLHLCSCVCVFFYCMIPHES